MINKHTSALPDNLTDHIPYLLRHCAQQLFLQAKLSCCEMLLDDLVSSSSYQLFCDAHPELNDISYTYHENEDVLGLLYQSLLHRKNRKQSGSFYTPLSVSRRLIYTHLPPESLSGTFLDPSCGTGIFLMQLPSSIPLSRLFGNDIDPLCITLTRINLALKYHVTTQEDIAVLYRNFTVSDYLSDLPDIAESTCFDVILGNPPWGAKLAPKQGNNYRSRFVCAEKKGTDSFDLFIEKSLSLLAPSGILAFVLPETVLSVKMHAPVRKLLSDSCTALSVEYLGDVFKNVYCPSIIFTLQKTPTASFYKGAAVITRHRTYTITENRPVSFGNAFSFALSDEEYRLSEKIRQTPNCVTLKGNADFALGIVTGNNEALLLPAPAPGTEPVIRGTDIEKYHICSHSGYIRFLPETFQQTAPESFYRAKEKLFYRFINRRLIFAYDTTGLLSLNSCNIVIPRIPGLPVKYVMAILNSSVAQFLFETQFCSVKILRSHLEALPIPVASENVQNSILSYVDRLLLTKPDSVEYNRLLRELDTQVASLFHLTEEENALLSRYTGD